jgi:hypothetical protein
MSNYSLLLALAGFRYAAPERTLYLNPVISPEDFRCFFSVDSGWGMIAQRRDGEKVTVTLELLAGTLQVERAVIGGTMVGADAIQRVEGGGYEINV